MFAWEASLEAVVLRRRFDDDEDEFENDGFTFDDEDEEDDELDDELEEEELEDEFEDLDDLDEVDRPRRGRTDDEEWEEE